MDEVRARFDDLVADTAFVLSEPVGTVEAHGPDEVAPALRAAEQAARDGRWVAGFVSYEAAAGLDAGLAVTSWPTGHPLAALPLVWFGVFARRTQVPTARSENPVSEGNWRHDRARDWHRTAVAAIRDAIAAGDYYQVNLTTRLTGTVDDVDDLYAAMCDAQGGAHHALIRTGTHTVLSASPELFFDRDGTRVITRPMKGTVPRGRWPEEDRRNRDDLRRSTKQRAENAMIVDLLRNDLARLAELGTVTVPRLFAAERFPTVWQLTSTVQAEVAPQRDLAEVFTALFPSGSVTGAPKRAAMSAIAELEQRPRGIYCGAVGFLAPSSGDVPRARFAVGIRTITCDEATGFAEYGTGGAITWSSRPDDEWDELRLKARVLAVSAAPRTLLETLRFDPVDGLAHLDRHLRRLTDSAEYFGFSGDSASISRAVRAAAGNALREQHSLARVRIELDRGGAVRISVADFLPDNGLVALGIAAESAQSDNVLLFHKHGDRRRYDDIRRAQPHVDDVVLWNERGEITETTIANLAVRIDGAWCTPALRCGLLPGIERGRLLENGTLVERVITLDELRVAESVAVLNSLRGWRAAQLTPSGLAPAGLPDSARVR